MEFIRLHVTRVIVAVFIVLFCGELSYKVKGNSVKIVYNVGDNITLNCYPPRYNTNNNVWYRNGTVITYGIGTPLGDPRITHDYSVEHTNHESLYTLHILNANFIDAGDYICYRYLNRQYDPLESYNVFVIGCTCSIEHHLGQDKVTCDLENYRAERQMQMRITINGIRDRDIEIEESTLSFFAISKQEFYNGFEFEFNPYTNAISSITCVVPAPTTPLPTTTHPFTRYPTTSFIQTTQNGAPRPTSQKPIAGVASSIISSTEQHKTTQNKNPNQAKNLSDSDITMIIVISGSIFILILIVLIIVLRYKQKTNQQENKHNGILSVDDKDTKEHPEACYESVDGASQRGLQKSTSNEKIKDTSKNQMSTDHHCGMVDNILYDSTDKIAESSISRTEGPLDNALYAMPDKRKTLDRESKSGTIAGSSAADILYGNSVIITQQGQKDNQGGDQYENVEMPGSGGGGNAEEIPLYEMPDKAPQRNTLKATPKANQTLTLSKDEVVDVDALYAEVDKTKKK